MNPRLEALQQAGVSVWLDDLSRERLTSGSLERLMREDGVSGVTTNPTIFANALSSGSAYDEQLTQLARAGGGVEDIVRELTVTDVRAACDVLRPVADATDGLDGRVSIEVDPRNGDDAAAMVEEARALWAAVDRTNLFIKIPATRPGLSAIADCLAEGISVNVTLIFSLRRYGEVQEAFLSGLERAAAGGHEPAAVASVASFFVSRVDSEIDRRLAEIGTPEAVALRGRAAIANARLAYLRHERLLASDRWAALAAAGARPQRPLWASTSVKDPAYPDTRYVTELVAPGVVNTMPEATLRAVADHGIVPADSIRPHYAASEEVFAALARIGVDYDDVVRVLEEQGMAAFAASWTGLFAELAGRMSPAGAAARQ